MKRGGGWVRRNENFFLIHRDSSWKRVGGSVRQNKLQASKEIFEKVLFGIFSHDCIDDKIDRAEATIAEGKQEERQIRDVNNLSNLHQ